MSQQQKLLNIRALTDFDNRFIWHPYTQAKIAPEPFFVNSAKGEFINVVDDEGNEKKLIDGISSWWVNIHGHCNPYIGKRLKEQVDKLEHVIFAGFTHEPAIKLVEKLIPLLPKVDLNSKYPRALNKAFFSDNGSTAVEVGIKMAIQYWYNHGDNKNRIIAIQNSYHGDTIGTMSTSDTPVFHQAFKSILYPVDFVSSPANDFKDKQDNSVYSQENEAKTLENIQELIEKNPNKTAAVLLEPLVQGAGGMKFHSSSFLQKLRAICDDNKIFLIADEVFTGFGRTGKMFACEKAIIVPDIICLSKGLTAGYMPMGLTVTTQEIYSAFHSDSSMKTFFHGHSFTGNPLSCAAAVASLELFEQENTLNDVEFINSKMQRALYSKDLTDLEIVKNIRIIGGIAVVELNDFGAGNGYLSDLGPILTEEFLQRQILLRPLGNVLYFLPPYSISVKSLDYVLDSIKDVLFKLESMLKS